MMRLRNTSPAFDGALEMADTEPHLLHLAWRNGECVATLEADLRTHAFTIAHIDNDGRHERMDFARETGNNKAD
jgi:sucrose phosphorylase